MRRQRTQHADVERRDERREASKVVGGRIGEVDGKSLDLSTLALCAHVFVERSRGYESETHAVPELAAAISRDRERRGRR